jgi:hypothetical protein
MRHIGTAAHVCTVLHFYTKCAPQLQQTIPDPRLSQQLVSHMSDGRFVNTIEQQKIVQIARSWVDTPYAPNDNSPLGIYKGGNPRKVVGADCAGAVWAIYKEAGLPYSYRNASLSFFDLVAKDGAQAIKGKHFFKQVSTQQTGDVGWWNGHVLIFDRASGMAPPNNVPGNAWSARNRDRNFSSVQYQWYNEIYRSPVQWFRYWRHE